MSALAGGGFLGAAGATFVAQSQAAFKFDPGGIVVSAPGEEMMSLIFVTSTMTFTAQRSRPGATFAVQATFADERPNQQCEMPSDLNGQLAVFSTITAKRQLQSQDQARRDFPILLGTLELGSRTTVDPLIGYQFRASPNRTAVAALYEGIAVEVATPESAFANLEKGCGFLRK